MAKKGGLGRGLDALFADAAPVFEEELTTAVEEEEPKAAPAAKSSKPKTTTSKAKAAPKREQVADVDDEDRILYVDINDIKPNSAQPRQHFDEEKLNELAASIQENGVIQPLIVRRSKTGFELVAGERRWRASRIAGLKKVPCIVRNFDEKQNAIVAIIENMQREDLDAIEEAAGLQAMTRKYGFTQEQVSTALGKSRAYIANSLRLLKLPEKVQSYISEGKLSAAHGRTLITVGDEKQQLEIAEKIIKEGLSVRATEKLAEKIKDEKKPDRKKRKTKETKSAEIIAVENELRTITGTKVNITGDGKVGKIELEYYSLEELNRLIDAIKEGF
ncbi:MAG: ParB/RepB/Spo0J family partition protein [Firmicutes bacterium]|nr:ParB/RepB/Spo0J family partition protein [Bacillota bacterium]